MAAGVKFCSSHVKAQILRNIITTHVLPVRHRHKFARRGKWPEDAKTFEQRLDEMNVKDPELNHLVNIGFPRSDATTISSRYKSRLSSWIMKRRNNERASRLNELTINLSDVKKRWVEEEGPGHIRTILDHYNIFTDLFGTAFFYNTTPVSVCYDYDEEFVTPVHYGNRIPACEVAVKPFVNYESGDDALWTLVMSCPDGNLQYNDKECLHWMVGNIPGSEVDEGEVLCDYLPPFPVRGVGHLRYIFILYRQEKRINFDCGSYPLNSKSLSARTFTSLDFYRGHQGDLTPSCLLFFQSDWDSSVTSVFHDMLDMKEPAYEFIYPLSYLPRQKKWPIREPFNEYLDRYRDEKDIQEEVLKHRLKELDPLKPPKPLPRYPDIYPPPRNTPSWLRVKLRHMKLHRHQWKDLIPDV